MNRGCAYTATTKFAKVLACSVCGKVLMLVPAGSTLYYEAPCICVWHCCEAAEPVRGPHPPHLIYFNLTLMLHSSGFNVRAL